MRGAMKAFSVIGGFVHESRLSAEKPREISHEYFRRTFCQAVINAEAYVDFPLLDSFGMSTEPIN
jgi:hypothetical protein